MLDAATIHSADVLRGSPKFDRQNFFEFEAPPLVGLVDNFFSRYLQLLASMCQVKSIHKQQTTIRKPIECAPAASSGGREWAEMTEGFHLT
jgi:hypothetical protein